MMSDPEELSSTATESTASESAQTSNISTENSNSETSTDEAGLNNPLESDDEEYEVNAEKYRIPKTLAAHLKELQQGNLRQDDYTRKTQTVAEQAKEYEARVQNIAAREQFQQQHIAAVSEVRAIDKQLESYKKLDLDGLMETDPVQFMRLDRQMRELQQQRTQIISDTERAQQQHVYAQQQATARQQHLDREMLARDIKGFGTPEVTKQLIEGGMKLGYKADELANMTDPRAMKAFDIVSKYYQLIAKQTAESKPKPAEIKPITRVSPGSGAVGKSLNDKNLSMADFVKLRNEQLKRK